MEMDKIPLKVLPKKVQKDFPTKVHFKKSPLRNLWWECRPVCSSFCWSWWVTHLLFWAQGNFFSSLFMKTISNNKLWVIAVALQIEWLMSVGRGGRVQVQGATMSPNHLVQHHQVCRLIYVKSWNIFQFSWMELMYQKNQIHIKSNQLVFCIIANSLAAFNVVSSQ